MCLDYEVPGTVPIIAQRSSNTCWAAVTTMMYSWKNKTSYEIEDVMNRAGSIYLDMFKNDQILDSSQKDDFLSVTNMVGEPPVNYDISGYLNLLQLYGPLWITSSMDPTLPFDTLHARILKGITGDSTDTGTIFKLINPDGGIADDETFRDFVDRFEAEVGTSRPLITQIVHW
jgi:papain like cysteine protease AvrRpt2